MLANLLKKGELTVAVYGLGYVGLALSAVWAFVGARVIGVDINTSKVENLNNGVISYPEKEVVEVLNSAIRQERFIATTDGIEASIKSHVKIVAVPISLKKTKSSIDVDFSPLLSTARAIGSGLKKGDLVIIESSVPPGTTEEVVRPVLESISGLVAEEDFYLAYSPERIMVGRAFRDIIENYPKIVAGVGPKSSEEAAELYRSIAKKGVIILQSPKEAEYEKLLEGVYRDINIALANEMAKLANVLGIAFRRAREAANSQPYSHVHKPGTGVGGNCIPVYPYFLMWTASKYGLDLRLVKTAREINERQPREIALAVIKAMIKHGVNPTEAKITILGLAFRGDVDDTRESPTYGVISTLLEMGLRPHQIVVHDPYVSKDSTLEQWGVKLLKNFEEAVKDADVVLVSTDHSQYRMEASKIKSLMRTPIILDARGVLQADVDIYTIDLGHWPEPI
ncbi:MAG: nucleotide sugar dehydrogenase [Pyrobaculum sp.]